MKRYEEFNMMSKINETVEEQAIGMMLEKVKEENKVEFDTDEYMKWFKIYLEWLNEEIE